MQRTFGVFISKIYYQVGNQFFFYYGHAFKRAKETESRDREEDKWQAIMW